MLADEIKKVNDLPDIVTNISYGTTRHSQVDTNGGISATISCSVSVSVESKGAVETEMGDAPIGNNQRDIRKEFIGLLYQVSSNLVFTVKTPVLYGWTVHLISKNLESKSSDQKHSLTTRELYYMIQL